MVFIIDTINMLERRQNMNKGMLIVIEGACDGIGKTTQFNMLIYKLKKDGIRYILIIFLLMERCKGKEWRSF